jgi:hypothetical protein
MGEVHNVVTEMPPTGLVVGSTVSQLATPSQHCCGKRRRSKFPQSSVDVLETSFLICRYPKPNELRALAEYAKLSPHQVKNWFVNRRNRGSRMIKIPGEDPIMHIPAQDQSLVQDIDYSTSYNDRTIAHNIEKDVGTLSSDRGRDIERQCLSNGTPRSRTPSAFSQCDDAVLSGPPRRGRKRKDAARSPNWDVKCKKQNTESACKGDNRSITWFQCTFCSESISSKSWKRHEETTHIPRQRWTCMAEGWHPTTNCNGILSHKCVFCGEIEPPEDHIHSCHRISDCLNRPARDRVYSRKDQLSQHLDKFHGVSKLSREVIEKWGSQEAGAYINQSWTCGFCGDFLENWNKRAAHIARHFREGMRMSSWRPHENDRSSMEGGFNELDNSLVPPKDDHHSTTRSTQVSDAGKITYTQNTQDDCDLACTSFSIGPWSFIDSEKRALTMSYSVAQSFVSYIMIVGHSKFLIRYSFADIRDISRTPPNDNDWYQESEDPFTIDLRKPPEFYIQTTEMDIFQRCHDFTDGGQASIFLVHNLVGYKGNSETHLSDLQRSVNDYQTQRPLSSILLQPCIPATADEAGKIPPTFLLTSCQSSRACPFCYRSFPKSCGTTAHAFIYSACSTCGKKMSVNHECMPPPNKTSISMFNCRGNISNGQTWGCGTSFRDIKSFTHHFYSAEASSRCLYPFLAKSNNDRDTELADIFAMKCRVNDDNGRPASQNTPPSTSNQTVVPTDSTGSPAHPNLILIPDLVENFPDLAWMDQIAIDVAESSGRSASGSTFSHLCSDSDDGRFSK